MKEIYLFRNPSTDQGTEGYLWIPNIFKCFSIELPWKNNKQNISCIPDGEYSLVWTFSNTFKRYMYLIADVPNRSGIRIHSGNWAGDKSLKFISNSLGCPLLGMARGILNNQKAVLSSGIAVKQFQDTLDGDKATLIIQSKNGEMKC